jgi:hypothetical protein
MSIGELNRVELHSIARHVSNRNLINAARKVLDLRGDTYSAGDFYLYPYLNGLKDVVTMTSKQIRENHRPDPECIFKVGVIMSPNESLNYFDKINRLSCVQNKAMFLKVLHGDIYTNDRLHKFGLRDNPLCDKCGLIDGIEHRLTECNAYSLLVDRVLQVTKKLSKITGFRQTLERLDQLLGSHLDVDITTLTIHSHVIRHVIYQRDNIPNQAFIDLTLTKIMRCESNETIKEELRSLLRNDY